MDFVRVYTGEDGNARFQTVELAEEEQWTKGFPTTSCNVRTMAVGANLDWHPAPGRLLFIHISGQLEVELRDGSTHAFGPGSFRLMEDVTGTGPLTRVVGSEPVVHVAIQLG